MTSTTNTNTFRNSRQSVRAMDLENAIGNAALSVRAAASDMDRYTDEEYAAMRAKLVSLVAEMLEVCPEVRF